MSLKNRMKTKRNDYWSRKISFLWEDWECKLEQYQEDCEYALSSYNIKLIPLYDSYQDISIMCVINNEYPEDYAYLDTTIYFRTEVGVRRCVKLLGELMAEKGFEIVSCALEFSEEQMKEDIEIILLEAVMELEG